MMTAFESLSFLCRAQENHRLRIVAWEAWAFEDDVSKWLPRLTEIKNHCKSKEVINLACVMIDTCAPGNVGVTARRKLENFQHTGTLEVGIPVVC